MKILTSVAAELFRPAAFPAHFGFGVCHRGVLKRTLFARANLLTTLTLVPLEVVAFHRVGVEDGFVSLRTFSRIAGYRV